MLNMKHNTTEFNTISQAVGYYILLSILCI